MNKDETLVWIDRKIAGVKALTDNPVGSNDPDDRRLHPSATQAQVDAEVRRLLAARKDVASRSN